MKVFNLSERPSIAGKFLSELRDQNIQKDALRFRRNMERLGEIMAYEISKTLEYSSIEVETTLGISSTRTPNEPIVIANILRAGLPLHQGVLNFFDQAENAFISAYRRHHKNGSFDIHVQYTSSPNLEGKTLLICDPMLATGSSMGLCIKELCKYGSPKNIHIITLIASSTGVEHIKRLFPKASLWVGDIDEELTAKSYIVPGLGDAGDLAFGPKLQE